MRLHATKKGNVTCRNEIISCVMSVTVHVKQFTFTMKINYTNIAQYMYYMFATIICWNLVVFY